jgi:hypothetical protein
LNTSRGETIAAYFITHPHAKFTILFSHGNATDIGTQLSSSSSVGIDGSNSWSRTMCVLLLLLLVLLLLFIVVVVMVGGRLHARSFVGFVQANRCEYPGV